MYLTPGVLLPSQQIGHDNGECICLLHALRSMVQQLRVQLSHIHSPVVKPVQAPMFLESRREAILWGARQLGRR
jgi:hypothetical protein